MISKASTLKPGILCEGIRFSYGPHEVLHGVDFSITPGEIYGLLGPNGAGKTTTLKILVGLLRPRDGLVRIQGHDMVTEAPAAKRRIAYVPDKPHLYERLTGWEYLEFVSGLWSVPPGWEVRGEEQLRAFGLHDVRHQLIESYSLGMRQKLLFVAGLLHEPSVWILDEPMSGLDPYAIRMMRQFFVAEAERGATILLSTHTMDTAERLCTRIGIIHDGRKVAEGTIADLRKLARREIDEHTRLEELFIALTEKTAG